MCFLFSILCLIISPGHFVLAFSARETEMFSSCTLIKIFS
ncbi:hypothetical protein M758_7G008600 [Ceratodon purpureus]|uniref:Uncharacterized protein n=1 Tax=Ceratodon purpureus TaxID=3225 RepID=A0A8T0H5Z8_CERPU|nr:hypothetical protein KC19_7G009200 [Ceratodon purpureus]KAG0609713.1 hypothetical protein M758_7G008600 [Ceratodon purpureus]